MIKKDLNFLYIILKHNKKRIRIKNINKKNFKKIIEKKFIFWKKKKNEFNINVIKNINIIKKNFE